MREKERENCCDKIPEKYLLKGGDIYFPHRSFNAW
jgi:hypothetical protein